MNERNGNMRHNANGTVAVVIAAGSGDDSDCVDEAGATTMNAREQVLSEYDVDERGIIQSPGKFEAEPLYAPYFSENAEYGEELSFMENGWGEYVSLIEVGDDDRQLFPEVGTALYVLFTENDQGFVSVSLVKTEQKADDIRFAYEPDSECDEEE